MKSIKIIYAFFMPILIEVLPINVSNQDAVKINGDFTIVGLFQVYKPEVHMCGLRLSVSSVMTSEAVKWYIEGLNEAGNLPFKIGRHIFIFKFAMLIVF